MFLSFGRAPECLTIMSLSSAACPRPWTEPTEGAPTRFETLPLPCVFLHAYRTALRWYDAVPVL